MEPHLITKEELDLSPDYQDTVFDGAKFFPVFCTADIKPPV